MASARTVLVTGGAGGIGRAIATTFHNAGDRVMIADLPGERLETAAAELGLPAAELDITDESSIASALDAVHNQYGPVDVLVNNAGLLSIHGKLLDLSGTDLDKILRTNVSGTFRMTQQATRRMIDHQLPGAVVNLSSIGGRQPTPGMGGYESSKAAVDALTRWAAIELAEHGIRVNAVAPGPVLTEAMASGMPADSPAYQAWVNRIPHQQMAAVFDVAEAVLFLAGESARHITGTSLPVDGGQLLT